MEMSVPHTPKDCVGVDLMCDRVGNSVAGGSSESELLAKGNVEVRGLAAQMHIGYDAERLIEC